uniref:Uncharacterized protein n=1 Tax=Chromera velia CCMP2878 TaxID=1169474 RepID=A0A0G4F8R7_9ALVE|eukprot:Cvel_15603.t1-p1 / transcript=Cvel_15603.t1 / gene=Cvel_15603 / organism=Chromera_velia_CCMP2878 / gene_product=hypothetical protein / transcript_product=hypothetical protein / location=Cvel_scaffold1161:5589-14266(-) / protein_length=1234 / sequence_SO=supercontig / SO=protein_coding / is_pseudo=false
MVRLLSLCHLSKKEVVKDEMARHMAGKLIDRKHDFDNPDYVLRYLEVLADAHHLLPIRRARPAVINLLSLLNQEPRWLFDASSLSESGKATQQLYLSKPEKERRLDTKARIVVEQALQKVAWWSVKDPLGMDLSPLSSVMKARMSKKSFKFAALEYRPKIEAYAGRMAGLEGLGWINKPPDRMRGVTSGTGGGNMPLVPVKRDVVLWQNAENHRISYIISTGSPKLVRRVLIVSLRMLLCGAVKRLRYNPDALNEEDDWERGGEEVEVEARQIKQRGKGGGERGGDRDRELAARMQMQTEGGGRSSSITMGMSKKERERAESNLRARACLGIGLDLRVSTFRNRVSMAFSRDEILTKLLKDGEELLLNLPILLTDLMAGGIDETTVLQLVTALTNRKSGPRMTSCVAAFAALMHLRCPLFEDFLVETLLKNLAATPVSRQKAKAEGGEEKKKEKGQEIDSSLWTAAEGAEGDPGPSHSQASPPSSSPASPSSTGRVPRAAGTVEMPPPPSKPSKTKKASSKGASSSSSSAVGLPYLDPKKTLNLARLLLMDQHTSENLRLSLLRWTSLDSHSSSDAPTKYLQDVISLLCKYAYGPQALESQIPRDPEKRSAVMLRHLAHDCVYFLGMGSVVDTLVSSPAALAELQEAADSARLLQSEGTPSPFPEEKTREEERRQKEMDEELKQKILKGIKEEEKQNKKKEEHVDPCDPDCVSLIDLYWLLHFHSREGTVPRRFGKPVKLLRGASGFQNVSLFGGKLPIHSLSADVFAFVDCLAYELSFEDLLGDPGIVLSPLCRSAGWMRSLRAFSLLERDEKEQGREMGEGGGDTEGDGSEWKEHKIAFWSGKEDLPVHPVLHPIMFGILIRAIKSGFVRVVEGLAGMFGRWTFCGDTYARRLVDVLTNMAFGIGGTYKQYIERQRREAQQKKNGKGGKDQKTAEQACAVAASKDVSMGKAEEAVSVSADLKSRGEGGERVRQKEKEGKKKETNRLELPIDCRQVLCLLVLIEEGVGAARVAVDERSRTQRGRGGMDMAEGLGKEWGGREEEGDDGGFLLASVRNLGTAIRQVREELSMPAKWKDSGRGPMVWKFEEAVERLGKLNDQMSAVVDELEELEARKKAAREAEEEEEEDREQDWSLSGEDEGVGESGESSFGYGGGEGRGGREKKARTGNFLDPPTGGSPPGQSYGRSPPSPSRRAAVAATSVRALGSSAPDEDLDMDAGLESEAGGRSHKVYYI